MTNWDDSVAPEVERFAEALLDSATADGPSDAAFRRTAAVLGLASLLGSGAVLVSGAARASSGMFAKVGATTAAAGHGGAAAAGSSLVLAKWAGAGLLLGMTTVGVSQVVFQGESAGDASVSSGVLRPTVHPSAVSVQRTHGHGMSGSAVVVAAAAPSQSLSDLELEAAVPSTKASSRSVAQSRAQAQANANLASANHVSEVVSASLASVESVHLSAPSGEGSRSLGKTNRTGAELSGPQLSGNVRWDGALPVAQAAFATPPGPEAKSAVAADGLQEEVRLVDSLRAAVARRDDWSLWALLTKYEREHPRGELRAEVAAIRARALSGSR